MPEAAAPVPALVAVPSNEPEEWSGGNDYTLRVQKVRIPLPGAAENGGPKEVEVLTYNGRLVGPTIRVRRGTTLNIKLINDLPPDGEPAMAPKLVDQDDPPHDLYTTNLHTHGLHVSPEGTSDDVFREVPPGASFQYSFTIPADHPTGTFWYHPHKHGSVAYQMANGLAGALIVEGDGSDVGGVRDLDHIPEVAATQERILVLQQLLMRVDEHGVGRVDPNDVYAGVPPDTAYTVTAVNGAVMPTYSIQPQEIQRWRIIAAGREGAWRLCWYNDKGMQVLTMPYYEIALDGLASGQLTGRLTVDVHPGKRGDVLVKAPAQPGTYYLAIIREDESGRRAVVLEVKYLARLVVQGPPRPMALPKPAELATCRPFAPIDAAECVVKRDIVLNYDDEKKVFHINGLSFHRQTDPDRPVLGTAEEWTISANLPPGVVEDEPHPFHIHVNPFQVVQVEYLKRKTTMPADEWRDTMPILAGMRVTIRIRFADFAGKTVFHCHTLDHEDQGMMRTIEIVDPRRSQPSAATATTLSDCRAPAPPLQLPTGPGATWDLGTLRGRNVVLVFFRGMGCIHCTKELRQLLQEFRTEAGADVSLVAISSEPIAKLDQARQALEVPPGLDFHLLVDEQFHGFRAFGCFDKGPQHGLFLIDKEGVLRSKYAGDVPFADSPAVGRRIRQLGDGL